MAFDILVPVDFSSASDLALGWAADLVKQCGGKIHLVHVLRLIPPTVMPEPVMVAYPEPEDQEEFKKLLAENATKHGIANASRDVVVAPHIGEEVVARAKSLGVNLIVMGTHGRGGVARFVMGSVAEHIVRHADCPVVTLRAPHK